MVKGISRRVVVVDSPDQRFFEQAIFVVRNDAVGGVEQLLHGGFCFGFLLLQQGQRPQDIDDAKKRHHGQYTGPHHQLVGQLIVAAYLLGHDGTGYRHRR